MFVSRIGRFARVQAGHMAFSSSNVAVCDRRMFGRADFGVLDSNVVPIKNRGFQNTDFRMGKNAGHCEGGK